MPIFALTIFLSAFLLFQVQPLVGRFVLPWFGGAPAIWTTCLLFFQVALLAGYAWADLLQRLPPRRQAILQVLLLAAAAAALPIAPSADLRPEGEEDPTGKLLVLLAAAVGLPYVALSSTGPLVQAWFARIRPGESAYRLYALSNLGSLLGLATYPLLVEPRLRLATQAFAWSGAFAAYAALCVGCGAIVFRRSAGDAAPAWSTDPVARARVFLWLALPFSTSALLLAASQQICQDVAPVPFLWALPLGLYLISFIIAFGASRLPTRPAAAALLVPSLGFTLYVMWDADASIPVQVAGHSAGLFALCLAAHLELVRTRPEARGPTRFYLVVAAGSSAGAISVAIVAPRLFGDLWEYHLSILLTAALAGGIGIRATFASVMWPRTLRDGLRLAGCGGLPVLLLGLLAAVLAHEANLRRAAAETDRNFYGVLRVLDSDDPLGRCRSLLHGRTLHGAQLLAEDRRAWPLAYYGPGSGVAEAVRVHPRRAANEPLRIGVVGLGTGTIAALAQAGDAVEFYEINPAVVEIARDPGRFTYLADAAVRGVALEVHLGDARRILEQQLGGGEGRGFDVLAIDAFSSDAIPVHLLTRECAELYQSHLAEGGVLAFHVSNRHLQLAPVVHGLSEALGAVASQVLARGDPARGTLGSDWILVTRSRPFRVALYASNLRVTSPSGTPVLWSDDFSSLLPILRAR